jgi:hypothetical protein
MEITVPMFVGESVLSAPGEMDQFVYYEHPEAVVYVRQHLKQVKQPIKGALGILALHGENMAKAAEDLKAWIDAEVDRLNR